MARGVHLRLGETEILNGVDLELAPGESVAVMGPSGSGKTSLLHVLSGLLSPDSGSVFLGDAEIANLHEKARRALRLKAIGFVFQSSDLIPELTFAENVALPLLLQGRARSVAMRRAIDALESVGLGQLDARKPAEASGGQRQRAAVARAVVHEPSVVLADEPTGALDASSAGVVLELLLERASERGAGTLVVTHDPGVAARCDQILFLAGGRLTTTPGLETASR